MCLSLPPYGVSQPMPCFHLFFLENKIFIILNTNIHMVYFTSFTSNKKFTI